MNFKILFVLEIISVITYKMIGTNIVLSAMMFLLNLISVGIIQRKLEQCLSLETKA